MPTFAQVANLWSLVGQPTLATEWSLKRKIRAVATAGFEGITARLTPDHRRWAEKYVLRHIVGVVSSAEPEEFAAMIRAQKEAGAVHINVQLDDHDTPPAVAGRHWRWMVREAEKIVGVIVSLETHRDCCTETPEKTYEIAARYFEATGELIKLILDFPISRWSSICNRTTTSPGCSITRN